MRIGEVVSEDVMNGSLPLLWRRRSPDGGARRRLQAAHPGGQLRADLVRMVLLHEVEAGAMDTISRLGRCSRAHATTGAVTRMPGSAVNRSLAASSG